MLWSFITFGDDGGGGPPPGTPPMRFSPHEAHAHQAFFGWIMPTIKTSEFTVLQIVGLDAAVHNKELDPDDDGWPVENMTWPRLDRTFDPSIPGNRTSPLNDWLDLINDANSYLSIHLIFTYLFTVLTLYFVYQNYRRFIRSRQLFSLELVHSIPARTVLVTNLPNHLQGERPLAEYFEQMGLAVESVSVCREVSSLKKQLDKRTEALLNLERAWVSYVGNPSTVEEYDPENVDLAPLVDIDVEEAQPRRGRFVVPHQMRPTMRTGWFAPKVDALEYLEQQFKEADELVKKRRMNGRFKATQSAFVTFEKMSSAQIAVQVAHAPNPTQITTYLAPEPRDIVWSNMTPSPAHIRTRDAIVLALMGLLFFFWFFPITALASLLSYEEIKKTMPWLGRLIDQNEQIRAIVQNSLPSVAVISLNAFLPFLLEALTYQQGYRARSWVEYSLLKKYFLFLLVNVVFIFLLASTYWQLVQDLANSPAKVPEKLAQALQAGRARHFFLSYVILQGLGIMPLQLLNLGVVIPRMVFRMFLTRTPRDFAELNAPPMINYGVVYPQAILIVVQPLIVVFGALYFGIGYVVYKYKLLFETQLPPVFYKPYESQGQAWPITFIRLIWGVVVFLVFMIGIFTLRQSYIISSLLAPLLMGTLAWSWYVDKHLKPLSQYVSLSSVFEVQRGEETADVMRLKAGHPVTWSQSNLNKRRYAQNDDTLYVAPEDERTDYSQPPMTGWYPGVLNTGKRRYGHPALNGVLPEPWLPLKKGQTLVNHDHRETRPSRENEAVVLTLRKRYSSSTRRSSSLPRAGSSTSGTTAQINDNTDMASIRNPWEDTRARAGSGQLNHRLSFDVASGVIMLPENGAWLEDSVDSEEEDYGAENTGGLEQSITEASVAGDDEPIAVPGASPSRTSRYGTYFHHPERRRQPIPGAFPGR
ncbi:hypothetical protein H0H93_016232 [Arthromyces matolae]|nr:hypothetical protein H0H93_016232 [Arthromyces matolae]